jgi:hypothetical protein
MVRVEAEHRRALSSRIFESRSIVDPKAGTDHKIRHMPGRRYSTIMDSHDLSNLPVFFITFVLVARSLVKFLFTADHGGDVGVGGLVVVEIHRD